MAVAIAPAIALAAPGRAERAGRAVIAGRPGIAGVPAVGVAAAAAASVFATSLGATATGATCAGGVGAAMVGVGFGFVAAEAAAGGGGISSPFLLHANPRIGETAHSTSSMADSFGVFMAGSVASSGRCENRIRRERLRGGARSEMPSTMPPMAKAPETEPPGALAPDEPSRAPRSRPPTSRLGRLARLGALGTHALPVAMEGARRALGTRRTEEEARRAREKMLNDARRAAHAMLKTLGEMKGVPLKIGQMVSYIDGLAPPGYEDKFQRVLARLQEKAPPLSADAAVRVVEHELGGPPEQVFASWERQPFAAASIGQVHRAVTRGGDQVAVKVQYPGIDEAIENDLKSLSLVEAFSSPLLGKYHTKQALRELREVFLSELDYTREAEMADMFRRMNADAAEILVPRVHHSLSTRRVLSAELVGGQTYQEFCSQASQRERDLAALTIWTFMVRSLLRYGVLYADPHPGNYRFLGAGKVAFLDYGCVKILPDELVAGIKRYVGSALDADWQEFDRACIEVLGYDPEDGDWWRLYRSYALKLLTPIMSNAVFEWSPQVAREAVAYLVRGHRKIMFPDGSRMPKMPKPIRPPPESLFINRLQWGLASILGGLRARAQLRPITEPWVREQRRPLPS